MKQRAGGRELGAAPRHRQPGGQSQAWDQGSEESLKYESACGTGVLGDWVLAALWFH